MKAIIFDSPRGVISGIIFYLVIAGPAPAYSGNAVIGKSLYVADCSGCHLASGAGGMHFNQAVSADLRSPGLETTYKHNDDLLLRAILEAKDETGKRLDSPMPAWKSRLSLPQALDIIAYLKTLHS